MASTASDRAESDAILDEIASEPHAVTTRPAGDFTVIGTGDPVEDALALTKAFWLEAPVVVVAATPGDLGAASSAAWLGAPLLVAGPDSGPEQTALVQAELVRLGTTHAVVTAGVPASALVDGVEVVEAPATADDAVKVLGTSAGEMLTQAVPWGFEAASAASLTPGVAAWLAIDPATVPEPESTPAPAPTPETPEPEVGAESASALRSSTGVEAAAAEVDGAADGAGQAGSESTQASPSPPPAPEPSAPPTTRQLPLVLPAALQSAVLLIVDDAPERVAAIATARAAGVRVHVTTGGDLRDDVPLLEEVAADAPEAFAVLGRDGLDADAVAEQVRSVRTGVQLPGGGQRVFAGKRYVALYGTPGSKLLGVLGEQDTAETIIRARRTAEKYTDLTSDTVVPTLEIIATIASKSKGKDGNYSRERKVSELKPLVDAAEEAGLYVILDLQPGRSSFVTQAKRYASLLERPHVGLALDPEWRLSKNQVHLKQIGSVKASEVNKVIDYLADLTAEHKLPQKMLVVHQFSGSMVTKRSTITTSRDEVAVVIHVDGQGTQPEKAATWKALLKKAPTGVRWGWKNFYDEDDPMASPKKTYQVRPRPHLVTYQ